MMNESYANGKLHNFDDQKGPSLQTTNKIWHLLRHDILKLKMPKNAVVLLYMRMVGILLTSFLLASLSEKSDFQPNWIGTTALGPISTPASSTLTNTTTEPSKASSSGRQWLALEPRDNPFVWAMSRNPTATKEVPCPTYTDWKKLTCPDRDGEWACWADRSKRDSSCRARGWNRCYDTLHRAWPKKTCYCCSK